MNNLVQFALTKIAQNPQIANNPRNKELFQIIQNGDAQRGQEVANNLCQTYGMSQSDALEKAKSFFGF